jgi:ParB family transcriptional regulator, chromosome partitioning protein
MTEHTTPTSDTTNSQPAPQAGTLEHLDPHTLVLDTNVRDTADLDDEFIASIIEHGVLIPIAATRDSNGQILVRAGQRRTLAARHAGLPTVPVYIRTADHGDHSTQLVQRVAEQIVENDQRRALTEAQRAKGIQQMLDTGTSITKVAKALSVAKDTVTAAATAATSPTAMRALAADQLSLTEAAALAEFDDLPGALDRLARHAGTPRFEHTVAQLRHEQASAIARQHAHNHWHDKGFTILDDYPRPWDIEQVELCYLLTADGAPADDTAVTNPAHWAIMLHEEDGLLDHDTGEPVAEHTIDWHTGDDPDAQPAPGLRHANTVTETTLFVPQYYCLDPSAAGLTPTDRFRRFAGAGHTDQHPSDTADLDRPDPDAAAAQAEHDAQRRERRKVIALNKLGEAAAVVRHQFLTTLVSRKTPPKGAGLFVATSIARDAHLLVEHHGPALTATLLGADTPAGDHGAAIRGLAHALPDNGDARAQVIVLAIVLGALEARTPKDAWRHPEPIRDHTAARWSYQHRMTSGDLLRYLVANGYTLSPVEQIITGERTADEVYDAYLAETTTPAADEPDDHTTDTA